MYRSRFFLSYFWTPSLLSCSLLDPFVLSSFFLSFFSSPLVFFSLHLFFFSSPFLPCFFFIFFSFVLYFNLQFVISANFLYLFPRNCTTEKQSKKVFSTPLSLRPRNRSAEMIISAPFKNSPGINWAFKFVLNGTFRRQENFESACLSGVYSIHPSR